MEAAASESISLFSFCLCVYNNMFYNIVLEYTQILLTISKLDIV